MTSLRIDIKALSRRIKEEREYFERDVANGIADAGDYRNELRCSINADRYLWQPAEQPSGESLRAALVSASVAAGQFGASDAQIDYIVRLATEQNDFNILSGGRLTKAEASRIIDNMKGN